MPTRWIMTGLRGFAIAAAIALALVAAGPVGLVRALGAFALAFAVVGMFWHTYLLRRYDPHAFGVLRYQAGVGIDRMRSCWARARSALHGGQRGVTAASP